ncbi:hypothetical protein PHYBLDRAFT_168127 [Phycomyces blakesleeanus NRRL 1555(-)]|uniref:Uncharacterized protein n=1 Tax=Phycomyces blakesleeanus (strain ATCC 8743b / DSM 1359 / FGSC 10004 / NBRC 33097 / NRRL 1555) TaxID=763407 RepID=A0A162U5X6_PHYB8|nr:hypothetical protein PHYBLDRAFT_168127 [Phycomyces blakesleeanus NRRL 1555(-)]OAD73692.1 hypothetical protein PHYBLDRAFT_168127 [Phycomyces blakesleeanus NRRL 1555(-)]|eukprot:XP_018291732.1 hypothetical protein PHYBLDRAFT_168127 [Phycomyces blakesleeanus NRRL 1555(-)]
MKPILYKKSLYQGITWHLLPQGKYHEQIKGLKNVNMNMNVNMNVNVNINADSNASASASASANSNANEDEESVCINMTKSEFRVWCTKKKPNLLWYSQEKCHSRTNVTISSDRPTYV